VSLSKDPLLLDVTGSHDFSEQERWMSSTAPMCPNQRAGKEIMELDEADQVLPVAWWVVPVALESVLVMAGDGVAPAAPFRGR